MCTVVLSHSSINPDFLKLWCSGFAQTFSRSRLFIYLRFIIFLVLSFFAAIPTLEELIFTTSSERVIAVLSYAQPPGGSPLSLVAAFLCRWALPELLSPCPCFCGWNQVVTGDKLIFTYCYSSCVWYAMYWQILPEILMTIRLPHLPVSAFHPSLYDSWFGISFRNLILL